MDIEIEEYAAKLEQQIQFMNRQLTLQGIQIEKLHKELEKHGYEPGNSESNAGSQAEILADAGSAGGSNGTGKNGPSAKVAGNPRL